MRVNDVLLIAAAIVPSIIIMVYVFSKDRVEKEPKGRLVVLFLLGCAICFPAGFLEDIFAKWFNQIIHVKGVTHDILYYLLVVALVEEGLKFIVLLIFAWRIKAFNCLFDGIVYAVFVSIGFATLENILYVIGDKNPFELASIRGLVAVPGHAIDAVFMGICFSLARMCANMGQKGKKRGYLVLSLLLPIVTHGLYDFLATCKIKYAEWFWLGFVVLTTVIAIAKIRSFSKKDGYITVRAQQRDVYY